MTGAGLPGVESDGTMPDRPRLLDLFSGAGGCTKGYQRAGFYVVGVDIEPQPNYCGDEFVQMDALVLLERLPLWERQFDVPAERGRALTAEPCSRTSRR